MKSRWPLARLDDVLAPIERPEVPVAGVIYRQLGVRLWGEGAYERGAIDGASTRYGKLSRFEADDVVVNKIWARNGSVAVVPAELAGSYGSSEFPTFVPDREAVDPRWIHWLTKTREFWERCDEKSRGTSGKNRIRPEQFLEILIPLPPLLEQRRIVAWLDTAAKKIDEVQFLQRQATLESRQYVISLHRKLAGDRVRKLSQIVALDEESVSVQPESEYAQVGVKSFGLGLFPKGDVAGDATTYRTFNRLYVGALVLSQVKGWEGAIGVCPPELAGRYVSPEYRTFRCLEEEADSRYLAHIVRTPWFWNRLGEATRGVGARRERTRPDKFLEIEIPMPSWEVQFRALPQLLALEKTRIHRIEAERQICSLLPSILARVF